METRLLKLAQSKGCGTISGAEMFVHQAVRQFEIWTGKPAPVDLIRQVLLRHLGAVGGENQTPIPTVVAPKAKAVAAATITAVASEAETAASDAPPETAKAAPEAVGKPAAKKAPAAAPVAKAAPAKAAVKAKSKTTAKPVAKKAGKAKR